MENNLIRDELGAREKSEYFRGLLVVMAADGDVHDLEKETIRRVIEPFGFSKEYIEESMADILQNIHVSHAAPVFRSRQHALSFLCDALTIAFADGEMHMAEQSWLVSAAEANGIASEWLAAQMAGTLDHMA
mgnify:CR=1 FL=1